MNSAIWVLQGFIAFIFLFAGTNKLLYTKQELASKGMTGLEQLPLKAIRLIGGLEVLGALGLVLPGLLHIRPGLTPLAALCLALVLLLAAVVHGKRKEPKMVLTNLVLLLVCVSIAYFRAV